MVEGEYPIVLRAPDGEQGSVILSCPMDARLAMIIQQLLAYAGWTFDTDAMRAEDVPMPERQADAADSARDDVCPRGDFTRGPDPRPQEPEGAPDWHVPECDHTRNGVCEGCGGYIFDGEVCDHPVTNGYGVCAGCGADLQELHG